ncbi:MAG: oligosaccharide flippase family protein [Epsilonproteobacteria bacterium]|nr:oligosaccharide flippase family protein [Campylobacterota bacterium]
MWVKNKLMARDGHFILIAHLFDKIVNFFIMMIAARYMSLSTFGNFSYVKSLVSVLIPFSGFGSNHALLRFGMDLNDLRYKYHLFLSALVYGVLFTFILILVSKFFLQSFDFFENQEVESIFDIYIFFLLSYYVFDMVRNFYRLQNDNKSYAMRSIKYSFLTLSIGTFTLVFFNYLVFLIIFVCLPIISVIFNSITLFNKFDKKIEFNTVFWRYGLFVGVGAFLNQFFLQADILILGYLNVDSELIAQYKVATLLVYTFLFIPNAILVRDFALISSNARSKDFLLEYASKYIKYTLMILLGFVPIFYFLSESLLVLIFGSQFQNASNIQNILIFGFAGSVLLRIPFGNILNAIGKAKWNVLNAVITIVMTIVLLAELTQKYGMIGTAYGMTFMFCVSGIISLFMFLYYLREL